MRKSTLILGVIIILLLLLLTASRCAYEKARNERDTYATNAKAYAAEATTQRGEAMVFKMRARDLEESMDTLFMRIDSIRKAAKVKRRNLKEVHWRETVVERVDTVWLTDSIFVSCLDTVLSDGWVETRISVTPPNEVSVGTKVRNETTLLVRSRRETVNPPRKFPLFRLFQRKHTVVEVETVEGNPHCVERGARHVEIID